MTTAPLPFLFPLIAALCLGAPASAGEPSVSIENPWMRLVMPTTPAAGYFTLRNDGAKVRMLIGAESPGCSMLTMHQSVSEGTRDRMIMVKSVPVPSHGTVAFKPGGYHLMCMSPSKDMRPGGEVRVTLHFADGGTISAAFPVRNALGQ